MSNTADLLRRIADEIEPAGWSGRSGQLRGLADNIDAFFRSADADRAVLDTAEALTAWWDSPPDNEPIAEHFEPLLAAVRARREAAS